MSDTLSLVSGMAQRKLEMQGRAKVCLICELPPEKRRTVEELMARGVSNNTIILFCREACDVEITPATVTNHIDHLPARLFVFREIVERRAKEAGADLDDSKSRLTPVAYLEMLMTDSAAALAKRPGTTNPLIGIQAAKALMDAEASQRKDESVAEWASKFRQILSAIREVCSQDQVDEILSRLRSGDGS